MNAQLLYLALGLALAGCGDPDEDPKPQDTDTTETQPEDTGSETTYEDQDNDGYYNDVDCDDNNCQVHPEAPELCDSLDNDCDEDIDEDFDADGDGHFDLEACDYGDDCDDQDGAAYPGADEVPYDGIDQSCDGEDLVDVDGDGFVAEEAGGNDCDDDNADVHPGAQEIPFDDLDNDCQDGDLKDADEDGYEDDTYGGEDCDDSDASINPDGFEWWNDGIDQDCDGDDGGAYLVLDDAEPTIEGDSGFSTLLGYGLAACDLDEDGLDDLIVTAPFYGLSSSGSTFYYYGAVGIFYGNGADLWTAGMSIDDADTLIQGDARYDFLGYSPVCGDIDGDGHDDLAFSRGEIYWADQGMEQTHGVLIYYGDGNAFEPSVTDADADAELSLSLGSEDQSGTDAGVVYDTQMALGDLDGDGAEDLVLNWSVAANEDGETGLYLLPGGRYEGALDLGEQVDGWLSATQPHALSRLRIVQDIDGDGVLDLIGSEAYYSLRVPDGDDTGGTAGAGDTGDTGYSYEGQVTVVSDLMSMEVDNLSDAALGTILGDGEGLYFGWDAAAGDIDGDGRVDALVSGIGESTGDDRGGAIYGFIDLAAFLQSAPLGGVLDASGADAMAYGTYVHGFLGYEMSYAGDLDGDGSAEFMVAEPDGGRFDRGRVYLVSGALLTGTAEVEDVSLLGFEGMDDDNHFGSALLGDVDFDGDGLPDMVISALGWDDADSEYSSGKVLIYRSGDWPF